MAAEAGDKLRMIAARYARQGAPEAIARELMALAVEVEHLCNQRIALVNALACYAGFREAMVGTLSDVPNDAIKAISTTDEFSVLIAMEAPARMLRPFITGSALQADTELLAAMGKDIELLNAMAQAHCELPPTTNQRN
jgi:hypothetical protein